MNTRHAVIDSPLGELTLVAEDETLTGLYFRHHWYRRADTTVGPRVDAESDDLLAQARTQLTDYLAGRRAGFDLPIALQGDARNQRIWQLLTTSRTARPSRMASSRRPWATAPLHRRSGRPSGATRCASSCHAIGCWERAAG
jgi:hypothetical protein